MRQGGAVSFWNDKKGRGNMRKRNYKFRALRMIIPALIIVSAVIISFFLLRWTVRFTQFTDETRNVERMLLMM